MTHETSISRATTIYYDGAGVHDNLVSMMVLVMLINVLMVLLLLLVMKQIC